MISQTEWIMALKKQISHDFYSKLTCLENAAVKELFLGLPLFLFPKVLSFDGDVQILTVQINRKEKPHWVLKVRFHEEVIIAEQAGDIFSL